jgi:hypothetical protein
MQASSLGLMLYLAPPALQASWAVAGTLWLFVHAVLVELAVHAELADLGLN